MGGDKINMTDEAGAVMDAVSSSSIGVWGFLLSAAVVLVPLLLSGARGLVSWTWTVLSTVAMWLLRPVAWVAGTAVGAAHTLLAPMWGVVRYCVAPLFGAARIVLSIADEFELVIIYFIYAVILGVFFGYVWARIFRFVSQLAAPHHHHHDSNSISDSDSDSDSDTQDESPRRSRRGHGRRLATVEHDEWWSSSQSSLEFDMFAPAAASGRATLPNTSRRRLHGLLRETIHEEDDS